MVTETSRRVDRAGRSKGGYRVSAGSAPVQPGGTAPTTVGRRADRNHEALGRGYFAVEVTWIQRRSLTAS